MDVFLWVCNNYIEYIDLLSADQYQLQCIESSRLSLNFYFLIDYCRIVESYSN